MRGVGEPPMVKLGRRLQRDWPEPLRSHATGLGVELPAETGTVLSTRESARELVRARPDVSGLVYLDAQDVEIAAPSYFHELLKFWPQARLVGANEDVQLSFDLAAANPPPEASGDTGGGERRG